MNCWDRSLLRLRLLQDSSLVLVKSGACELLDFHTYILQSAGLFQLRSWRCGIVAEKVAPRNLIADVASLAKANRGVRLERVSGVSLAIVMRVVVRPPPGA